MRYVCEGAEVKDNIIPTLQYVWLTIKHKYFVFRAGIKTRAPIWNLVIHDWTKFLPSEAPHYGRQFFGSADDALGFTKAWLHHQSFNPHHWEYWIPRSGHSRGGYEDNQPISMPEPYVREMVADWMGASRAYEGSYPTELTEWQWMQKNWGKLNLHKHSRIRIIMVLQEVFGMDAVAEFRSQFEDQA